MKPSKNTIVWLPLAISISVVAGMLMGNQFSNQKFISDNDRKLNTILNLIGEEYVDTVNIGELVEQSIPQILANLDPHTTYIPAKDLQDVNNELEGSFGGIGISFMVLNDTTYTSTQEVQLISAQKYNQATLAFTLSGTNGKGLLLTDFTGISPRFTSYSSSFLVPARFIESFTVEPIAPRSVARTESSLIFFPTKSTPSTLIMRSPAMMPTFSEGPPAMTSTTVVVSLSTMNEMPMPPKLPSSSLFTSCRSLAGI